MCSAASVYTTIAVPGRPALANTSLNPIARAPAIPWHSVFLEDFQVVKFHAMMGKRTAPFAGAPLAVVSDDILSHRGFKTMYRALFLALAAPAVAFVPPAQLPAQSARVAARSAVSMADSVEMSESLPMLPRPMKLKGWTGDVGFDPLGLSVRARPSTFSPRAPPPPPRASAKDA